MLAYATWSLHAYCATCETPTCDTKVPTCGAQPRRRNCNLKQSNMLLKRHFKNNFSSMLLPLPERIKKKFQSTSQGEAQMLSWWLASMTKVGDNDLARHEFLNLCTVTATPIPVDSVSAWLQPFFRSHIVRSNDSLCRFTCHENHRSRPQWSPSSSKPSLGLTHGKCQILIGCQLPCQALIHNLQRNQETDRRTCNTTVSQRQHGRIQKVLLQQQVAVKSIWSTIVYYCLQLCTKPFNCLLLSLVTFCWGVFVARRALTKSLTSFWGSTWHWLWMRQGCWSRLSSKLLDCAKSCGCDVFPQRSPYQLSKFQTKLKANNDNIQCQILNLLALKSLKPRLSTRSIPRIFVTSSGSDISEITDARNSILLQEVNGVWN